MLSPAMKHIQAALTIMLAAGLTGCMSFPGDYGKSYAPGLGCVIIGWGDQPNNFANRTSGVRFQGVGSDKTGAITFSHLALEYLAAGKLFTDQDGHGVVAVRYLPPGQYELHDPYITVVEGLLIRAFKPTNRVSIPFQVRANECTYTGRFLLSPTKLEFLWITRKETDLKLIQAEIPPNFSVADVLIPKPIASMIVTK